MKQKYFVKPKKNLGLLVLFKSVEYIIRSVERKEFKKKNNSDQISSKTDRKVVPEN